MKISCKTLSLLFIVLFTFSLTACSAKQADTAAITETAVTIEADKPSVSDKPAIDRAGTAITVPDNIDRILTLAPSITQTVQSLGFSDRIVGIDNQSKPYLLEPLPEGIPEFDMAAPDNEAIMALEPDIIFVTGMSFINGVNPYEPLIDMGVCIASIPSSESIDAIKQDITFIADCLSVPEKAVSIVTDMDSTIEKVRAIGEKIPDDKRKTVSFEISAMPYIYSFGSGTYLNEMIEIIGAKNVWADENSWIPVSEEAAIAANPDVILTSVNYIDDPAGEILSRPGWDAVTAVKEKAVYAVTSPGASIPNQFITETLVEMAKDIYPDEYKDL
jgi:iron complex transport system substrate-binding protein